MAGGSIGGGIRVAGANTLEILPTTGAAPYIQFLAPGREAFETHPSFESTAANVDRSKVDKHVFEIRQTNQTANALVGGVTYQIKAPFKK